MYEQYIRALATLYRCDFNQLYKPASAALKILARCSTLRRFSPCIRGFLLKKPLGKANRDTP
ncbi:hypothetical protein EII21_03600 [Conchiformibius steedae]|uniref:Uncharacterized protein n=1 Tax=Conchiformibius steedae TaxID=153493 RepID=A0A3P2A8W0_9NEIS|nr:hypothetical protein EII21_03600 [Conchiformibius steedae]